jgi:dCTP deaminase
MLLSDRELKAALASDRMGLAPYDEAMVQPSCIDVRLDRYFRAFANPAIPRSPRRWRRTT